MMDFYKILIPFFFIILIGCAQHHVEEGRVYLSELNLSIDQYEVSIGDFKKFIDVNNYKTTSDKMGWSGVFNVATLKWDVVEGANWLSPRGKEVYDDKYPVSQISYMDACAYCEWKGGRLPTAKEWDLFAGNKIIKGNVWEGPFPHHDSGEDGYLKSIAPIGQFTPNEYGIHDLFGNVWEWTSTKNVKGEMIIKGGSFLCDISYCSGYIPSKYQTTAKDSGLNHLGFRCVYEMD